MAFAGYNPGWTCQDEPIFNGTEFTGKLKETSGPEYGQNISSYETFVTSCEHMRSCSNITFSPSVSTIVTEWTLVCDNSWIIPFITSIQMAGSILGSLAGGDIGDRFGRKFTVYSTTALIGIGNLVALFSTTWEMYIVVGFFLGFASGGLSSSLNVYNSEFFNNWWRGFLMNFPFWNISTSFYALCVIALKNWRHVHLASALVSLVAFLPVFWLPESLRFLTVHGKVTRAHKVVQKIAKMNKKPVPDTNIINTIANKEKEDMKHRSIYSYLDLFHANLRKTTIVLTLSWFSYILGYLTIGFGIGSLSGDFFVNLLLFSALPVPMRLFNIVLTVIAGRRVSCLFLLVISIVCSFSVAGIQFLGSEEHKSTPTLVMALGASMVFQTLAGTYALMTIEHNPTAVRNLSFGVCTVAGGIGSIIAPYLSPTNQIPMYGTFLLLGFLQLACFAGHLTLPETKGKPLQDNLLLKNSVKR